MPGITAFIRFDTSSEPPSQLLTRALNASYTLPDSKSFVAQVGTHEVAFGGIYPRHFQRAHSAATRSFKTLLFYGELYNNLGHQSEAEFVLDCILNYGYKSVAEFNGPFVAFLTDETNDELVIITDRLGRFPVFYESSDARAFFSTDLHGLFNAGIVSPDLDEQGVVDFLTIGFPLGEGSIFSRIKRIPGGEIWRVSRRGTTRERYWEQRYTNSLSDVGPMIETFRQCLDRALRRSSSVGISLSGGWDSRATCSVAASSGVPFRAATFGVEGSTDVSIARSVARALRIQHTVLEPHGDFFESFHDWARKVIILSSGHAMVDLAFQIYMYERMLEQFPTVIDSAGCEFRRGIRALRTAETAKRTEDVTRFLTSMYATGIWNETLINDDFFRRHATATGDRLTRWLDSLSLSSYEDQIDAFSSKELWMHHYAHGYPLQTNVIGCQMPFSDNEFYDLFLQSSHDIRWSHVFHHSVIHQFAPQLERLPISHGHVKVRYGESMTRYAPIAYHRVISRAASIGPMRWLRRFDNYKPFRPYHEWYGGNLDAYVQDTLFASERTMSPYINISRVRDLLEIQRRTSQDVSHPISIVLTLAHLLEYVSGFRQGGTKGK